MMTGIGEPIRVLHVLQRMEAGGTQTFLMNLYRNIDRSKVQFDFLVEYGAKQFYDDEIESMGGMIYRSTFREDKNLPRFIKYLRGFFADHPGYAAVHCHAYTVGYFVLREAERAGVAVRIAHSHNNNMSGITKPLKIVMRALFPIHANSLMACSDEAGKFLFGNRIYTVVKNAIDVDSFVFNEEVREEVRKDLGLGSSLVVGNVGRLHHQKNQLFLLDVFKEVMRIHHDARLLIVGDGPLEKEIFSKAEEIGVMERLILLKNRSDMARLYQAMDVFVLPSLYEGLGIVAIESQSAGLSTICSNGVAEEANVSPLFIRMNRDADVLAWARTIVGLSEIRDGAIGASGAVKNGFDVKGSSLKLQQWYIEEARRFAEL